jgi:hypothetical protein
MHGATVKIKESKEVTGGKAVRGTKKGRPRLTLILLMRRIW